MLQVVTKVRESKKNIVQVHVARCSSNFIVEQSRHARGKTRSTIDASLSNRNIFYLLEKNRQVAYFEHLKNIATF